MGYTNYPNGITSMGVPVIPGLDCGVGLGEVFWVVPAKASTNLYYEKIRTRIDDDHIFTTLTGIGSAHAACTSWQGDTIFVAPGVYTTTAEMDFSKSGITVVGMDGPNNLLTYASTRDMHACTFYTVTAAVPHALHVYGARNKFFNIHLVNAGAAATNLTALKVGGITTNTAYGNYFHRCTFHGCMSTDQNTTENSSVQIGSGSSNYMFEDCIIGQNTFGGDRATNYQGHVYYSGTNDSGATAGYASQNGIWRRCIFLSRSASDACVPMIRMGDHSIGYDSSVGDENHDRVHWWIDCHFSNWSATAMETIFLVLGGPGTRHLVNCSAHGYLEWHQTYGGNPVGGTTVNMPVSHVTDAGIAVVPTG